MRASQARGQLKTLARPLIEAAYGISPANAKRDNRNLVEDLQDRVGFAYKVCSSFCYSIYDYNFFFLESR